MEMLPLTKHGCSLTLIGAHGLDQVQRPVNFVSVPRRQTRVMRILLAVGMAFRAVRHPAQLYHVHNPEMIPAGLLLKLWPGNKVVYDTQEDHPSMMLTKAYLPSAIRWTASKVVPSVERLPPPVSDGFIAAAPAPLPPTPPLHPRPYTL